MSAPGDEYLVGVGIADVTGEAGGVAMMGYALPYQRTAGIHLRQWARAFIIAEPAPDGKRIVFVNTDLGMIFQIVHQEVLRRLEHAYPGRYAAANTMLSATHNHSGPGGYSHYNLYNLTTLGFRHRTFEAIVSGIVLAIDRAEADLAPGTVSICKGDLFGANVNRSLMAFERNPVEEKAGFPGGVDPAMTALTFARNGVPVGVLSWFATHGTSITNVNRLISSDNKGYAAYLWEHDWAGRSSLAKAQGERGFVAGFAQGSAGDMSPNLGAGQGHGPAGGNYFANARVIGTRQALKARELMESATETLSVGIDYRQRYVDFSHIELDPEYVYGDAIRTWPAIVGQAFTSGCVDARGLPFIKEGDFRRHPMFKVLDRLVVAAPAEVIAGHGSKPVGLATGSAKPYPWTPQVLPLQIIRIGQLALVAGPGEFTITAGRRIREAVAAGLGDSVRHIVFAGYTNGYAGYVTTPQEYSAQLYEGASTHFGAATLPAYQQEYRKIADALAAGRPTPSAVEAPDLAANVWTFDPQSRIYDVPMRGRNFGDVAKQPKSTYAGGDIVEAEFHSACPSNDTRNGSTFAEVQRCVDGEWRSIATDDDWDTMFHWKRLMLGISRARISWRVPESATPGSYRIVHNGNARNRQGTIAFSGTTQEFAVTG